MRSADIGIERIEEARRTRITSVMERVAAAYPILLYERTPRRRRRRRHFAEAEVRSGDRNDLLHAAVRLREAMGVRGRVLRVPQAHMGLAVEAMLNVGVRGTIRNLSGTRRVRIV